VVALGYAAVRWGVLHPYGRLSAVAPVFVDQSPSVIRLTAVAALADLGRLLVLPASLRVDYGPLERTAVTTVLDARFVLGAAVAAVWAGLLGRAWRRQQVVPAFGLGWIGLAVLPVANLLFPAGVLVAERTLYLPSVGIALVAGALLARLEGRRFAAGVAVLTLLGGARSALRVPVWRDDRSVTMSILDDSPRSYRGPARVGALLQTAGAPSRALDAYARAIALWRLDAGVYFGAADAAFTLGRAGLADSLLLAAEAACYRCVGLYRLQAAAAAGRGDSVAADSLLARAARLSAP
jgi:hypothetical protein